MSRESCRKPASILSACQYHPGLGLAGSPPPGTKRWKQLRHEPPTEHSRPGGRLPIAPQLPLTSRSGHSAAGGGEPAFGTFSAKQGASQVVCHWGKAVPRGP